jgi:PTH1 family peptidyl-tRNA hydrolase
VRLILGIGNPGNKYKYTRHNTGFLVLDYVASLNSLSFSPSQGDYYAAEGIIEGNNYQLIKPVTYINNSGLAVKQVLEANKLDIESLLVIHDDVNIPQTEIRVKVSGSDGGHNGLASIIWHLMSDGFARIRIGIGNDFKKGGMADYVLSDFTVDEMKMLEGTFKAASTLISGFIKSGINGLLDENSRLNGSVKNPGIS